MLYRLRQQFATSHHNFVELPYVALAASLVVGLAVSLFLVAHYMPETSLLRHLQRRLARRLWWGASVEDTAARLHTRTRGFAEEEMKMTLVVRKDLKMGSGKVAAQCAHAAVALVEQIHELQHTAARLKPEAREKDWLAWYEAWQEDGCAKVALQCPDEAAMLQLAKAARAAALPYYVIRDAGRTQIASGSKTVLGVGPGPKSLIDAVTGHLRLL